MLDFSGNDQRAQLIAAHYAEKLESIDIQNIINLKNPINSKEQALELSRFYWKMLDAAAYDFEHKAEVLGEVGSQYWMERLLNIISGHLDDIGYEEQWDQASDEA